MCSRFTLMRSPAAVAANFNAEPVRYTLPPRFNIWPMQPVLVVHAEGGRHVEPMRWGLIPSWSHSAEIGERLYNARAETLTEKPAFKAAIERRRCLIPADGFYSSTGAGEDRHPVYIHRCDDALFAFAGLWEEWESPDGSPVHTCTIITTEASAEMATIRKRMPVILASEDENLWLDHYRTLNEVTRLLKPHTPPYLRAYPVADYVYDVKNEGPACIRRRV